jgi:hypothetical protein
MFTNTTNTTNPPSFPAIAPRAWFPPLVFTIMMFALFALTFTNDEHLAAVFHDYATAWALIVHMAIVALPPTTAMLPPGRERWAARTVWLFALVLAAIANVAGNVAHAANVTPRAVLDGWPVISQGAGSVAILGGLLLIVAEGVIGFLWEASLGRLFAAWVTAKEQQVEREQAPARRSTREVAHVRTRPANEVAPLPEWVPAPLPVEQPVEEVAVVHEIEVKSAPVVHEQMESGEQPREQGGEQGDGLAAEEREALLTIKHAVNPHLFTTGEANEHSPFARTRTNTLLGAAETAGILNKAGRGRWSFARPENGHL